MKERPIIFSSEMVKAILCGNKTQTRRVIKPQPKGVMRIWMFLRVWQFIKCPYGQVGDKLWVRETWIVDAQSDEMKPSDIPTDSEVWYKTSPPLPDSFNKWRSGRFMPRWASRITLEIIGIRVERVQEISYEDILAEGIKDLGEGRSIYKPDYLVEDEFIELWDSINAQHGYSWESNPWVWVIEFNVLARL